VAFLPLLAAAAGAAGTVYSGVEKQKADEYNAQVMGNEQKLAVNQANAQAGIVTRQGVMQRGRQLAAFGGAGVGYGGSSETALDQSAINNELDALNTKYKGTVTGYGYGVESGILNQQANQQGSATALLAGGQALSSLSKYYAPPPPSPTMPTNS
jgi:hypothetical protein